MKNTYAELKQKRIENKLKTIQELYDLTFKVNNADKIINFRKDINFINGEKELVDTCKIISKQIKDIELIATQFPDDDIYHATAYRLRLIFSEISDLIKEEFRTIRTRNNRLPRLEM